MNGPNGLAIDAEDPNRLYLAVWGRSAPAGAVDGGIFVSSDGGTSWRNVLSQDRHVYDITADPLDPKVLYACGFESSAWRSTDRGETWKRIRGYNFKWGHRVIPDPQNPGQVYITTFGGSVWHGPAAGDPQAVEDIVTPALAYSNR
ncbi:MAG: WD40/YVTN/BNR-like repeat-containing protein [Terriglobia bacterium]